MGRELFIYVTQIKKIHYFYRVTSDFFGYLSFGVPDFNHCYDCDFHRVGVQALV